MKGKSKVLSPESGVEAGRPPGASPSADESATRPYQRQSNVVTALRRRAGQNVLLAGAGNIGSYGADLLARDPQVDALTIVDREVYTEGNLSAQKIERSDVGRSKAQVTAHHVQRIAGNRLDVKAYHTDLNLLPWGIYRRADVIISCFDSRSARIQLATICWRMGRPMVDCGVNGEALLGRVTSFTPGRSNACYMCTIADWSQVEGTFTCGSVPSAPTGAPAYLGAITAAMAVARLHDHNGAQEVVFDCQHEKTLVSRHVRNAACPFNHETWTVKPLVIDPFVATWGALFKRHTAKSVAVAGDLLVTELVCDKCGAKRSNVLTLRRRGRARRCGRCGGALVAAGTAMHEHLPVKQFPAGLLNQELVVAGIQDGDILTFDGENHFEIQARAT